MSILTLNFDNFKYRPYIKIDGKPVRVRSRKNCSFDVSVGVHEIFVCEKRSIFKWYWWIRIFNLFNMLLMLKGFGEHPLGYDGKCAFVTFCVDCPETKSQISIKIKRNEVPWDRSDYSLDYTTFTIYTSENLRIKDYTLDSKQVFRLKFNAVAPMCMSALLVNLILINTFVENSMPIWEIWLSIVADCYLIGCSIYEIYKTKNQKSFEKSCNIPRVIIKKRVTLN